MNMKKLGLKLSELDLTFDRVNWGGCGSVAAMIATTLRHQFPIMRITSTGNFGKTNLDEVRHHVINTGSTDDWYNNGVYFSHVWVEVFFKKRWYVLDATGVHSRKEMYKEWGIPAEGSFSIDEMQALADDGTWNSTFNRDQLPAMQEMINNLLPLEA